MKPENFDRRNFLRIGAAGVVALGVAETVTAKNSEANNKELLKSPGSMPNGASHGSLEGLSADDHPQYLNDLRGDVRYYQKPESDSRLADKVSVSSENQPNGYAGLDADGKINQAQIGNFTSPQNGQTLQLRDGAVINVTETYRRLDTEFGVIADGVVNNAPAIQNALSAVRDSYGGTLVFPNGVTRIAGDSSIDSNLKAGAIKMMGSGNSVVQIAPGTNTAFAFHNNPNLTVEGLTFIGVQGANVPDLSQAVFFTSYVEQVTFRDCQFLGLMISAPYGEPYNGYAPNKFHGIISANECDLLVERCIFGGNATENCGNITANSWNSLTVRDCQFVDYGYHKNQTLARQQLGTSAQWVRAINAKPNLVSARIKNKVTIERTTFDECCSNAVMVYGAQWVEINNLVANMGLGETILLVAVKYAKIRDSFSGNVGLTTISEYAVGATHCGLVEVENFTTAGTVKYIVLDGTTQRAVFKNCQLQGGGLAANGVVNNAGSNVQIVN